MRLPRQRWRRAPSPAPVRLGQQRHRVLLGDAQRHSRAGGRQRQADLDLGRGRQRQRQVVPLLRVGEDVEEAARLLPAGMRDIVEWLLD